MVLLLDIGNSRIKYAVFKQDTLFDLIIDSDPDFEKKVYEIFQTYTTIRQIVIATVRNQSENDFNSLKALAPIHLISRDTTFPFTNCYQTPQTLGIDRMILAAGAALQYPKAAKLIIDAGTAVTYDYLDAQNNYYGGAISPGLQLRFKSLNDYTAKLPLVEANESEIIVGGTTLEAIHSGVVNGLCYEIDGFIESLQNKNENFIVILTGGDAEFLAKRLKSTIFANPNFLLESLNALYQFQTHE